MKNNMLKKAMAILAVLTISLTVTSSVCAAGKISSKTGETQTTTASSSSKDGSDASSDEKGSKTTSTSTSEAKSRNTTTAKDPSENAKATVEPDTDAEKSISTVPSSTADADSKYTTKGGAVGWFFLGLILNAIISFCICMRFYKMSKKDNHISAEIRALRRDVSNKFSQNVDGFIEYETRVKNTNPSYAKVNSNIKSNDDADEDDEKMAALYEKWGSEIQSDDAQTKPLDPAAPSEETLDAIAGTDDEQVNNESRRDALERFASGLRFTEKSNAGKTERVSGVMDKLKTAVDSIMPKE